MSKGNPNIRKYNQKRQSRNKETAWDNGIKTLTAREVGSLRDRIPNTDLGRCAIQEVIRLELNRRWETSNDAEGGIADWIASVRNRQDLDAQFISKIIVRQLAVDFTRTTVTTQESIGVKHGLRRRRTYQI